MAMSGIMERINRMDKMIEGEKMELIEDITYHHQKIRVFLEMHKNDIPFVVVNALEDRLIVLNQALSKLTAMKVVKR